MTEFEIQQWSEEQETRIDEENTERAERSERAAEINCRGCDPEYLKRWYDDQPIEVKIKIQKKNIFDCKLMGFGHGVKYFEAKLAALMEEKKHGELAGSTDGNGSNAGVVSKSLSGRE